MCMCMSVCVYAKQQGARQALPLLPAPLSTCQCMSTFPLSADLVFCATSSSVDVQFAAVGKEEAFGTGHIRYLSWPYYAASGTIA